MVTKCNVCFMGKGKKITHLMYLFWFRDDIMVIINPTWKGLQVHHLSGDPHYFIEKYRDKDGRRMIDVIEYPVKDVLTPARLMFYNCISIGKKMLGIKGIIFTPEQFRKRLLKNGGVSCLTYKKI